MEGSVESWNEKGFGVVRGSDGNSYFAHFHDFVDFKTKQKRITVEVGQEVTFTPAVDAERNGRRKTDDVRYDSRSALFRFAYFPRWERTIADLATNHARTEKWSSSSFDEAAALETSRERAIQGGWQARAREREIQKFGKVDEEQVARQVEERVQEMVMRDKFHILFSYLERTFERLKAEEKIVYSDTGAAFNTNLGNKFDKDIYALFKRKQRKDNDYEFDRFADENLVGKAFPSIPAPPDYFHDIGTGARVQVDFLIFNFEKKLFPDYAHCLDERIARFPDWYRELKDEERIADFDKVLDRAQKRVRRDFRTAVPFYYPAFRKVQMLLPGTFIRPGTSQEETKALVVSRTGAGYSVETIMPLDWAYKNARLMSKPDREAWLDF